MPLKLRPVAGIVLRQYYLLRGNPARLLPMVAWVAIDMVLWGFIARYLEGISGHRIDFVGTLLGAVLFWICSRASCRASPWHSSRMSGRETS